MAELELVESGYSTKLPSAATCAVLTAIWRVPSVLSVSAVTSTAMAALEETLVLMFVVSIEPRIVPVAETS